MAVPPTTYVRHAMPKVEEGTESTAWHLDEAARGHARAWADRLEVGDGIGVLLSSTEPKALETASAIGERWSAEVRGDDRLREAVRPWIGTGYRAIAHRYLRGEQPDGWEPHHSVSERVAAAVADAHRAAGRAPVV